MHFIETSWVSFKMTMVSVLVLLFPHLPFSDGKYFNSYLDVYFQYVSIKKGILPKLIYLHL